MSEEPQVPPLVSDGEKVVMINIFKNIKELLRSGLFLGENSEYVHGARTWLDGMVKKIESELPQPQSTQGENAPPDESLKGHPKLEVVPNE